MAKSVYNEQTLAILRNLQDEQAKLLAGGNSYDPNYLINRANQNLGRLNSKLGLEGEEAVQDSGQAQKLRELFSTMSPEQVAAMNNQAALKDITGTLNWEKDHPGFRSDTGDDGFLWDALDLVGAATLATGLYAVGSSIIGSVANGTGAAAGTSGASGTAGAVGGGSAAAGGVEAGAGLGGIAAGEAAIPSVIISAPAGAAGGGVGLGSVAGGLAGAGLAGEALAAGGGEGLGAGEVAGDHLPEGVPLAGTEGNVYPIWEPQSSYGLGALYGDLKTAYGAASGLNTIGKLIGGVTDYKNNQQNQGYYQDVINKLNSMYAPGSPEEQLLRGRIEAQDAAAGRRSQYGTREVNLAGQIAQQKANIMSNPTYGNYINSVTGANSNQYSSLLGALGASGGIGGVVNGLGNLWNTGSKIYDAGKNLANSLFGD